MQTANDKRTGHQVITADLEFSGFIEGSVSVEAPAFLDMRGMVTGDVTVSPGAKLVVRGTVDGAVLNRGGTVEVLGTVGSVSGDPPPYIAPGAWVRERT